MTLLISRFQHLMAGGIPERAERRIANKILICECGELSTSWNISSQVVV
uniref:Uncharacterized protein n=1 Tax=Arundo donax TaxID=35708 RepID=A0A0A8YK78_ARUDO